MSYLVAPPVIELHDVPWRIAVTVIPPLILAGLGAGLLRQIVIDLVA
jgi:hypothetical protein